MFSIVMCHQHLYVLSTICSFYCVKNTIVKITDCKAIKSPLFFQYLTQQIFIMTTTNSFISIIRCHNTGCACVNTIFKMWKENFLLCSCITGNIYPESGIFHGIKCIMFYACHNVFILYASHQCRSHGS